MSVSASMALEVIKPPLQPASQGAGGSYGNGTMSTQMDNTFSAENCNPNMNKEAVTPAKCTPKKTPVKSKTTTLSENGYDMGKSPVRRRLDCDGGAHQNGTFGKSPAKAALLKETGTSPHKHFCRSPRCAANNPDYAVPAPRQYLKSKRHLLAGWQPPLNSKLKAQVSSTRGEDTTHGCSSNNHTGSDGEQLKEQNQLEDIQGKDHNESSSKTDGNDGDSSQAAATSEDSQHQDSKCTTQKAPKTESLSFVYHQHGTAHGEEGVSHAKDRTELSTMEPVLATSACLDLNGAGDRSLETLAAEITSTCMRIGGEVAVNTKNQEVLVFRADPTRASTRTESDYSMRSICEEGSDSRRETFGSSRPPRRRYQKKGGRRLSSGTASSQPVALNKQEGLKRKQAEEWMWDTAIKDAVQRLAPNVPAAGCVNVLVKAFESVKLTEEEIRRAKYKNMAVNRMAHDSPPVQGGGGAFDPNVSQMDTIASISKVQAWDESMASADLVDEMDTDKIRQDEEDSSLTPKTSQARIPQFSRYSVLACF